MKGGKMNKTKKAQSESNLWGFIGPNLKDLNETISKEARKIKQSKKDKRKFGKLVNIKRGLS